MEEWSGLACVTDNVVIINLIYFYSIFLTYVTNCFTKKKKISWGRKEKRKEIRTHVKHFKKFSQRTRKKTWFAFNWEIWKRSFRQNGACCDCLVRGHVCYDQLSCFFVDTLIDRVFVCVCVFQFVEKRREMKSEGRTEKELEESYCFLLADNVKVRLTLRCVVGCCPRGRGDNSVR